MAYTNVGFKYGLQANLNTLITNQTAEPGCFYLTSDTQRLYVGKEVLNQQGQSQYHTEGANAGKIKAIPASVNAGIQFVDSTTLLPTYDSDAEKDAHAGEFYYIPTDNILCVFSGKDFIQINSTENTYVTNNDIEFINGKQPPAQGSNTVIPYTHIRSKITDVNGDDYEADFGVIGDDILSVSFSTEQVYDTNDNGEILYTQDGGAISTNQTANPVIKNRTILHIGENKYTLSATGETYTFDGSTTADGAQIELANGSYSQIVNLIPGENVTIDTSISGITDSNNGTPSNAIKISAEDTKLGALTIAAKSTEASGNLSGTGYLVSLTDSNGDGITPVAFNPEVQYLTSNNTYTTARFDNNVLTLPIFDSNYLGELIRTFNVMTYRGVISASAVGAVASSISVTEQQRVLYEGTSEETTETYTATEVRLNNTVVPVSNGDVFLVNDNNGIAYNGVTYSTGTLFIAQGQEDNTGYIPAENLRFDVVEDTSDTDTTYQLLTDTSTKTIKLQDMNADTAGDPVKIDGATNNKISVSLSNNEFTISHDTTTRTNSHPTNNSDQNAISLDSDTAILELVTGVTTDSFGHVSGVQTTYYDIADQKVKTSGIEVTPSIRTQGNYKEGLFTLDTDLVDAAGNSMDHANGYAAGKNLIASQTLDITSYTSSNADGQTGLAIELKWGTF